MLPGLAHGEEVLHAGPMHAWTELRSTAIWVQTSRPADVQLRYFPAAIPAAARLTPVIATVAAQEYIATFLLAGLEPATTYRYELYIDGTMVERPYPLELTTQPLWRWRQPAPDFEAMFGSCLYVNESPYDRPGKPYGSEFEILAAMAARRPDLMLWLGDNLYTREVDFFSPARASRRATATTAHSPSCSRCSPRPVTTRPGTTTTTAPTTPTPPTRSRRPRSSCSDATGRRRSYGTPETPGVFQKVSWGDADFFLLDDRWHRKPNDWPAGPDKSMMGRAQMEWLKASLIASEAVFKVVVNGNQVLNANSRHETMTKFADTEELIAWIARNRIEGVLFLSGDRHHGELVRIQRPGVYPLYDFTSSSITAGVHVMKPDDPEYVNPLRVDGTLAMEHNFGVVRFSGAPKQRRATLQLYGVDGALRWERTITRDELSFPKPESGKKPSTPRR